MVGWLDAREFEQAPRVDDGQGGLACCSPWGRKELDTTERLNSNTTYMWMVLLLAAEIPLNRDFLT